MTENVKVAVRVRPFNSREVSRNATLIISMSGNQTEIKDPENIKAEGKKFAFDYSYWSHDGYTEGSDGYLSPKDPKYADQKKVFDDLGKGVLENAWKGYNCSLFAYGQTGSGKSYSMVGYGNNKGIVPLVCEDLFKGIDEKRKTAPKDDDFQVTLSMLEIYNEQVRDLLSKKAPMKGGLKVRQHPSKGFYVETLTTAPVSSYSQIENKVNEGTRSRTVASTNMNATSSRAHTIIAINFAQKQKNEAGQNMTKTSIINLVDLAGSERAESTGATGDRLKEGSAINQSLSMLGNCIKALADISSGKKKVIVPFRDSVLTKLLQNALGGNSKTVMIAALSPADINYEETLSTLRFADRAKAIKTSAVINESPTDKLIRELREENAKLMEMLKNGGLPAGALAAGNAASSSEVDELKRELEEQMAANQRELEEMKKSWEERMKESQKESMSGMEAEKQTEKEKKVIPHFWNLNEDAALTGMIVHFCKEGASKIGNKNASPAPQILMNGLSIQKDHATVNNKKGVVTLKPSVGAKIVINGKQVQGEVALHHNDRVLFGSTHLYVFHHPQDEAKLLKSGKKLDHPTYDSAQEEIAKESGIMQDSSGKSKEDLILQEELISLLPMVGEANAMSEELDKKVKFEIVLISPLARGLKEGPVEIKVKMKNLENGNWWMFEKNNFINRKYMMQDMYQNYMDGDKDWDVPKEKDPFWEPHTTPVMIGTVTVFLQTIPYLIEMEDKLNIMDVKGVEVGKLDVKLHPCDAKGNNLPEDVFIDEPKEWLTNKKSLSFKFLIQEILGIPTNFDSMYCQYRFFVEDKPTVTNEVKQKAHADLNYQRKFDYKTVTKQFLDYCESEMLVIEVWGKQKEDGAKSSQKSELKTKDLMQKERSNLGPGTSAPGKANKSPTPAGAAVNDNQLAAQIQEQVKKAKAKGMKSVPIEEIEQTLARLTGAPEAKNPNAKGGKSSSRACVLQ